MVLTVGAIAERSYRTMICAGQTLITDRGYARIKDFQAILAEKANFISRIGWRSLELPGADGERIDILSELPTDDRPLERRVHLKGIERSLRSIVQKLPADKAEQKQNKVKREAC